MVPRPWNYPPPYHPATNRAAESLVQSLKQSLRKSSLTPTAAVQEFPLQYCHTPLDAGYSLSELLNGRQIQSDRDTLISSLLKASKLTMLPGFNYWRLLTKCLDSNAGTWLVHITMLCIETQRRTSSHGGYLQSWPRCLRRVLWGFVSCPGDRYGDGISISYASDTVPTKMQIRERCLQVWQHQIRFLQR